MPPRKIVLVPVRIVVDMRMIVFAGFVPMFIPVTQAARAVAYNSEGTFARRHTGEPAYRATFV